MYDWNVIGKHDALDDAIFHLLLDDDLNRYPPKGGKSSGSSGDDNCGCAIIAGAVPFCQKNSFYKNGTNIDSCGIINTKST